MDHPTPTPRDPTGPRPSAQVIEQTIGRVEALSDEPILEHVEAFEAAHQVLQERLNEAADG